MALALLSLALARALWVARTVHISILVMLHLSTYRLCLWLSARASAASPCRPSSHLSCRRGTWRVPRLPVTQAILEVSHFLQAICTGHSGAGMRLWHTASGQGGAACSALPCNVQPLMCKPTTGPALVAPYLCQLCCLAAWQQASASCSRCLLCKVPRQQPVG